MAVMKGIGYAGAHIGGPALSFEDIDFVISEAKRLEPSWQEFIEELSYWYDNGFYYYEKDGKSGLNSSVKTHASLSCTFLMEASYKSSHAFHSAVFSPEGPFYGPAKSICTFFENSGYAEILMHIEHLIKFILFGCKNCGDCRIDDLAYLCPQSGCAKYLLNGPCGGSRDGWCEVYPDKKKCFYVNVYQRLACQKLTNSLQEGFQPPREWAYNNTSSWLNFFNKKTVPHPKKKR